MNYPKHWKHLTPDERNVVRQTPDRPGSFLVKPRKKFGALPPERWSYDCYYTNGRYGVFGYSGPNGQHFEVHLDLCS